jgi:hypothetical protein
MAVFTLSVLAGWTYYVAFMTGAPRAMASSAARLVPGYVPVLDPLAVMPAAVATVAWVGLVFWRAAARPPMLWRGPVLAATGLISLWVLLATLFLPAINYNRSYAPIAAEVQARIAQLAPGDPCVVAYRLAPSHRALFAYHGRIRFAPAQDESGCNLLLQRDSRRSTLDDDPPGAQWRLEWEGRWAARADETLRLYTRTAR